jgi:formylglycine-generating enzyme required for sulfatase activity
LNNFVLASSGLPLNSYGYFLASRDQGSVFPVNNSQGRLCLGGFIGRYVGQGQIMNSGATGSFVLLIDLTSMPHPFGNVAVHTGETWNFQAWYRDANPAATSNFTNGLEVLFTAGQTVPAMVPIPAGTFLMGSSVGFEQPVHQVTLTHPFWMGQHEVTQAEYEAIMGSNPSFFPGPSLPVETVSWHQARNYCAALTAQQVGNLPAGYEYRLPTEAEWEYACRAGTTTEFHYGQSLLCSQARFAYSFHSNPPTICNNTSATVPVESYEPNAFGLYDMHGNVVEWCLDSYAEYASPAVKDPFVTGGIPFRIVRGGSWDLGSNACRSAARDGLNPDHMAGNKGFRVVLAPVLVP